MAGGELGAEPLRLVGPLPVFSILVYLVTMTTHSLIVGFHALVWG